MLRRSFDPCGPITLFHFLMAWHPRHNAITGHTWFREAIRLVPNLLAETPIAGNIAATWNDRAGPSEDCRFRSPAPPFVSSPVCDECPTTQARVQSRQGPA